VIKFATTDQELIDAAVETDTICNQMEQLAEVRFEWQTKTKTQ